MELEWGSVADWFAAVGTVGALFTALAAIKSERKAQRFKDADAVIVRAESLGPAYAEDGSVREAIEIYVHNAGAIEIPDVAVYVASGRVRTSADFNKLAPSVSETRVVYMSGTAFNPQRLAIIVDAQGRRSFRDLKTGQYVSGKSFAALLYGKGTVGALLYARYRI